MTEQQSWPIESVTHLRGDQYEVELVGLATRLTVHRERFTEAGITPPAPDIIDFDTFFDTFPVGTVLLHKTVRSVVIRLPEGWVNPSRGYEDTPTDPDEWTVVHVPVAPDKRAALHTLGLTDNDIAYIANKWMFAENMPTGKIVAAAREVTP